MEPADKQNSSSKGTIVATGVICSIIGGIVGALGTYMYEKGQKEIHQHTSPHKVFNRNETCPICLEEMQELTILPCGHQYHRGCSNQLKSHQPSAKCPICRKTISD